MRCVKTSQGTGTGTEEAGVVDKRVADCREAVGRVFDGATIMFGGFGNAGMPARLIDALRERGARDLTLVSNGAGTGPFALGALIGDGRVRKLIASFPAPSAAQFRDRYLKGEIELELAAGKEVRVIEGREHLFETPLRADFVFLKGHLGDRLGNLMYRGTMRNFNMVMATAGEVVIAEVDRLVEVGGIPPEQVHTPGIFVDHVVEVDRHPKLLEIPKEGT
jgi:3-oxoadipate CoA-transferase alpha subunit